VHNEDIEFLLVRTRGSGRWTFPKGSAEPGLTHAQAAALEAFEEAGVHGRIEETSFARYVCRKRGNVRKSAAKSAETTLATNAHLCQVLRLGKPKESNRDRTWFSAKDARRHLREGREREDGAEFARVVDKALARIHGLRTGPGIVAAHPQPDQQRDALQKVQFEAAAVPSFISYRQPAPAEKQPPITDFDSGPQKLLLGEVLQFGPVGKKKTQALGIGVRAR
jgi:8-oxo-dGTP pyrophosphatase MutT (NUDIX family)